MSFLLLLLRSFVLLVVSSSFASTSSSFSVSSSSYDWTPVLAVIDDAITRQVFPGAVAAVRDATGALVFTAARGNYTYGIPPPSSSTVLPDTLGTSYFDMASCSKIIGPTTTAAYLWQEGFIELDMPVSDPSLLGPAYAVNNKDTVTIRNLLLHNAGYPPDPSPGYWEPSFPCPNNNQTHPSLDFSCTEFIYASLLNQTLEYPPYTQYIYSDLSMITMMYVLGTIIDNHGWIQPSDLRKNCVYDPSQRPGLTKTCVYEAFWRLHILPFLGMSSTGYLLDPSLYGLAIPAWNDTTYRNEIIQGYVSDENSYANGGIQGHAGIFATLNDVTNFTAVWAYGFTPSSSSLEHLSLPRNSHRYPIRSPLTVGSTPLLNRSTVTYWTTVANASFSSRALGWDTQAPNDYYVDCGNLSTSTYYHTGYTGTLMCVDPQRNWTTVLLTNRVYPNKTNNDDSVAIARQMFNNAVIQVLENPNRTDTRSLRQAVAAKESGFFIGTAVDNTALRNDTNYSTILPYQYNIYVPENAGKWGPTNPYPNIYNYSEVQFLAEQATNAFSSMRYHNIVWHNNLPPYLCSQYEVPQTNSHCIATNWSSTDFQYFYDQRVNTTAGWIKDYITNASLLLPPSIPPIYCIDVVNEAINSSTAELWDDVFYKYIGPDYIARAFTLTKLIVPANVVLVYNDFFLEGTHPAKTQAAYTLLQQLRQQNIPIDAVGFQMHYGLAPGNLPNATHGSLRFPTAMEKLGLVPRDRRYRYVDEETVQVTLSTDERLHIAQDSSFYKRVSYGGLPALTASMALFASLNITIQITEMDISIMGTGNNNTQQLLAEQGEVYQEVLAACIAQPACTLLATWGFTDKYTWLGSHAMPLPFDITYQRKPAFDSLYNGLVNWTRGNVPVN